MSGFDYSFAKAVRATNQHIPNNSTNPMTEPMGLGIQEGCSGVGVVSAGTCANAMAMVQKVRRKVAVYFFMF